MNHTVDTQHMEALQALSATNMAVSEAKATLSALKEDEKAYLVEREKKALAHIKQIHADSAALAKETKENYEEVHEICHLSTELAGFIGEAYGNLTSLTSTFQEHAEEWKKDAEKELQSLAETKKLIKADRIKLENEKKGLENAKKALEVQKRKLADERSTLERAIKRLKEGRI